MNYDQIVKLSAPCGLDCSRCVTCAFGQPRQAARELKASLGGFAAKAPLFAARSPALAGYGAFEAVLESLAQASCPGCRTPNSQCNAGCGVKDCVRTKGVDFCSQCAEYPCTVHGLRGPLEQKWRQANDRMKAVGVEAWWDEQSRVPRY